MDFKKITLPDVGALRPYLRGQYRSCDYSVLGVFMWADRFGYEYNISDGVLFMRERSRSGGGYDYLLPLGEGSLCDRVRALRDAVGEGLTMSLVRRQRSMNCGRSLTSPPSRSRTSPTTCTGPGISHISPGKNTAKSETSSTSLRSSTPISALSR